ncbi:endochitinase A [Populus nigra]|uniref:endochitinase A n=1 Tax=Populus nigra TaxID=3691 RepID=UPI002B27925D|nr:endochitinase A [Populus nigra]
MPNALGSYLLSLSKVKVLFPAKNEKLLTLPFITAPLLLPLTPPFKHTQTHIEREREREMKGSSKIIMGATLAMVVSLAIVLALVLVLLAELYCSLLLRRRQLRSTSNTTTTTSATTTTTSTTNTSLSQSPQPQNQPPSLPLPSYYAQGVLRAPKSFLFPAVSPNKENKSAETRKEHSQLHRVLEVHTQVLNPGLSPQQIGLINISPPSTAFVSSPHQVEQNPVQIRSSNACNDRECAGCGEHLVYISNPIYDNDASRPSRVDTPYETPDSSPSRLETCGSSSGEEEIALPSPSAPRSVPGTPPLTPMKKLPAKACSVSLRDARSLGTSGSDSVSNNGLSSSSSGSPCTSPSW